MWRQLRPDLDRDQVARPAEGDVSPLDALPKETPIRTTGTKKSPATPPHKPCFLLGWRTLAGMTQEELPEAIGWAKSTVSAVETGQRPWSQPFLENVVDYLRTRGLDKLTIGDVIEVDPYDSAQIEIWHLSRRVPEGRQDTAADVLHALTAPRREPVTPRAPIRRRRR
jgi:transcriptional regulator with XRE-family HTH domain